MEAIGAWGGYELNMPKVFRFLILPSLLKKNVEEANIPPNYQLKEYNKTCLNCGMCLYEFIEKP